MRDSSGPGPAELKKEITLRHAVALYVSSVLGSGVLVLPGLAAQLAGPASLVAWGLLSIASYPFAFTFASLSARRPESGGVYAFAKESFGIHMATVTGWLFVLWFIAGAPAVTLIAASYLGYAFPIGREGAFIAAAAVIFSAFFVNRRGIVFSNTVQVVVVACIVGVLLIAVASSAAFLRMTNFSPFLPHGWLPVGTAAALIFWSYLGYENVSNIAEEFRDPRRDFKRSIVVSVLLIGFLYTSVAVITVGTLAYEAGGSVAPFAAILSNVAGRYGVVGTSLIALFIIFGTVNAYTAGMSRVVYAVARDGGFPQWLNHIDPKTGVPDRSLILLFGLSLVMLVAYYALSVDLATALLIPSGAAILVYVIGSAAGIRLLRGTSVERTLPWISLGVSLVVLPFVGVLASAAIIIVVAGYLYSRVRQPIARERQDSD